MIGFIIGGNCEKTVDMAINSLEGCKKIYFLHGGSKDKTEDIIYSSNIEVIEFPFEQKPMMPAIQKNKMLEILKENHLGEWCIYIDADEVLDDNGISKIENLIKENPDVECYDIRMIHLIDNLVQEDATANIHRTQTRIFKVTKDLFFPEQEHCLLDGMKFGNVGFLINPVLFHLAYCGTIFDVKKRYDGQMKRQKDGLSHSKDFLNNWYRAHLFGAYPKRQFNPLLLPKTILDNFSIDKDELYFANRGLETKHFIMAKQWIGFFNPNYTIEFGCGRAPFGHVFNYLEKNYLGIELSKFAVEHKLADRVVQGDIINYKAKYDNDLVIAFDVLEHISYENLDKAIHNLIDNSSKYILVSVPVKGDPNLEADPTHIIKETKQWWIEQFTNKGLKLIPTPEHFLYSSQIMIFEK